MDCITINKNQIIDKYLLAELPDVEKEAFEKHFFHCDSCFNELKSQKQLLHLIQKEGDVLFAEFLKKSNKVKETVQENQSPRYKTQFINKFTKLHSQKRKLPIYAMTALFFIVISSIFIYQNYFQLDFNSSFC